MPMFSKNSTSGQKRPVNWVAMALPLAITVGCAGSKSEIIDYTISKAEYEALVAPAPAAEPKLMAAKEIVASASEATAPTAATASLPSLKLKQMAEPAIAAAKPATDEAMLAAEKPFIVKRGIVPRKSGSGNSEAVNAETSQVNLEVVSSKPRSADLDSDTTALSPGEPAMAAAKHTTATEPLMAAAKPAIGLAKKATARLDKETMDLPEHDIPVLDEPEPKLARARTIDPNRLGFTPSIYTTAGLGISRMNPDTSAAPGFETNDNVAPSGQIALGVDVARFLSLELHSADLGSTSLSPNGRVNFHVDGVSALLYAGKNRDRFRRRGLNAYARVGFNRIENTPVGDVPFIEQSSNRASFGLGAEYTTRFGVGLRADVTAFDGDVQYGQVGLLYRLASKPRVLPKLAAATAPETPEAPEAPKVAVEKKRNQYPELASTIPALAAATSSTKADLQANKIKLPADTTNYQANTHNGNECNGLNGALPNVTFLRGSAKLTQAATIALNDIANTLSECSDRQVVVSAHTDNAGAALDNNHLSKMRARTVAVYLATRGVDKNRMRAVAYGESRPVASNATPQGRSRNRRVELEVK